jgi:hypothetical protein
MSGEVTSTLCRHCGQPTHGRLHEPREDVDISMIHAFEPGAFTDYAVAMALENFRFEIRTTGEINIEQVERALQKVAADVLQRVDAEIAHAADTIPFCTIEELREAVRKLGEP